MGREYLMGKIGKSILCLLLFASISLAGCSNAVPQAAGVPQRTNVIQNTKTPGPSDMSQDISQKPSPETPGATFVAPTIMLITDKIALIAEGLTLNLSARIRNPNRFDIDVDNIEVLTGGVEGADNILDTVPGGLIESYSYKKYCIVVSLPNNLIERKQIIKVSTRVISADKTLPISATTELYIPEVINKIMIAPGIIMQPKIAKISQHGADPQLEARIEGKIENTNPVSFYDNSLRILIKDKTGKSIGVDDFRVDTIAPNSDYSFNRTMMLPIQVMNETGFTVELSVAVQSQYYLQTFKYSAALPIPKLAEIISVPQINLETDGDWLTDSTVFNTIIRALINNDNEFDFTTGDLTVNIYNSDHAQIATARLSNQIIQRIRMNSTGTLTNTVNLTPCIVGKQVLDITIAASLVVGVDGVNEKIPLKATMPFRITRQQ